MKALPRRRVILVAGASGLIGTALVPLLRTQGFTVRQLVRRAAAQPDELQWNPARGELDPAALEVHAVINLSGANVAAGRWTKQRRDLILRSRLDATKTLVTAMLKCRRAPEVFLSASATGFYGNRGDDLLDETARNGDGFLAEVCRAWEGEAREAGRGGVRATALRFGVVLTPRGGALARLLPIFRLGLGGRVGGGRQWMSWISIDDAVCAVLHAMENPGCEGAMNLVAPEPIMNAQFTTTLAKLVHRPALLPVPAIALRALFGQMANETLLASTRALPRVLQGTGYQFRHASLEAALRHVLGAEKIANFQEQHFLTRRTE